MTRNNKYFLHLRYQISEELRKLRVLKNKTLEDISKVTNICINQLKALELRNNKDIRLLVCVVTILGYFI